MKWLSILIVMLVALSGHFAFACDGENTDRNFVAGADQKRVSTSLGTATTPASPATTTVKGQN